MKHLRVSYVVLLASLLLGLPARPVSAEEAPKYVAHRPTIMLLGDSLTEFGYGYHWKQAYATDKKGWVALLADFYSRKADIINRGLSGYNSRWAVQVLPQALMDLGCPQQQQQQRSSWIKPRSHLLQQWQQGDIPCRVQLLVIWYGANDLVDSSGSDGRLHVPVSEYKKNLAELVATARQAGVQQVVLATPPPVDEAQWAKERNLAVSDRKNSAVQQYAAAARQAASELHIPLLDIHSAMSQKGPEQLKELLNDGVHLAPAGQQLVFQSLKDLIQSTPGLNKISPSSLPNHYPLFSQVDESNPSKTFKDLFGGQASRSTGGGPTV